MGWRSSEDNCLCDSGRTIEQSGDLKCYFFSIVKSRKNELVNDALKVIETKKRIIREILNSKKLK